MNYNDVYEKLGSHGIVLLLEVQTGTVLYHISENNTILHQAVNLRSFLWQECKGHEAQLIPVRRAYWNKLHGS